jgi:hypothetical protein
VIHWNELKESCKMKASITKGLVASAAAFAIAGAFAQVQTGDPSNGSKLGVTPPPSTSVTTDTSRLATDCDRVAADQRAHQAGGTQVNSMTGCGHRTGMGATAAAPPTVGNNGAMAASSATPSSSDTSMAASGSSDTHVASSDMGKPHKARKARADRG